MMLFLFHLSLLHAIILTHFRFQLNKRAFQLVPMSSILLRDMLKYTASVREWMSADSKNIIAIHCKGGKGGAKDPDLFHYHLEIYLSCTKTLTIVQLLKKCNFDF